MTIMKKYIKKVVSLLLACITLLSTIVPSYAAQVEDNSVSPAYAVPITASCDYSTSDDLTLYVSCTYAAGADSGVTRVDITAYVEKRSLLVLWNRVDIGQPNDEWTSICYGLHNSAYFSAPLPSSGTYRVTCIFEVYQGTTLVETIEKTTPNFTR